MGRFAIAPVVVLLASCAFDPQPQPVTPVDGGRDAAGDDARPMPDGDVPIVDAPGPDAAAACAGYTPNGMTAYLVGTADASWANAQLACEAAANGHLVVIENPAENTVVRGLIPTTLRFWLGMSDLETENTWLWLDGSAVPRAAEFWDGGQPNNSQANGGEDCGEMSNGGTWNDDNCNAVQAYVCECP